MQRRERVPGHPVWLRHQYYVVLLIGLGLTSFSVARCLFALQRDRQARAAVHHLQSCARGILTAERIARTSEAIRFTVPSQAEIRPLTRTTWLLSSLRYRA